MSDRGSFVIRTALLALVALLVLAGDAMAYAGPAPGPEFFGYFLSLVAWLSLTFSALLLWPIHALRRRFRTGGDVPDAEPAVASSDPLPQGQTEAGPAQP